MTSQEDSIQNMLQALALEDQEQMATPDTIDFGDLLALHRGELSEEDSERIRAAMVADPQLARRYLELRELENELDGMPAALEHDVDAAWSRFETELEGNRRPGSGVLGPPEVTESHEEAEPPDTTRLESADKASEWAPVVSISEGRRKSWFQRMGMVAAIFLSATGLWWITLGSPPSKRSTIYEGLDPLGTVKRSGSPIETILISSKTESVVLFLHTPSIAELGFSLPDVVQFKVSRDLQSISVGSSELQDDGFYPVVLEETVLNKLIGNRSRVRLTDPAFPDRVIGEYEVFIQAADP